MHFLFHQITDQDLSGIFLVLLHGTRFTKYDISLQYETFIPIDPHRLIGIRNNDFSYLILKFDQFYSLMSNE